MLTKGEVTLHFESVAPADKGLLVGFFMSNGLSQKIKFEKVPLLLVDSDQRVLARQSFDGEIIGEVASGSSKACVVRFLPDNVYVKDIVAGQCKVCFDLPSKQHRKIEYQALPAKTTESQKQGLNQILEKLPAMEPGEVSFSPLHVEVTTDNNLITTVIIRNSSSKKISLDKIPLIAFDAQQKEIARGQFDIKELSVEPSKAVLCTFNFGPIVQDQDLDLSKWSLKVVQ